MVLGEQSMKQIVLIGSILIIILICGCTEKPTPTAPTMTITRIGDESIELCLCLDDQRYTTSGIYGNYAHGRITTNGGYVGMESNDLGDAFHKFNFSQMMNFSDDEILGIYKASMKEKADDAERERKANLQAASDLKNITTTRKYVV
jgi:hypothetical protein